MDFEEILVEVGEYGFYQKRIVYLFLMPNALLLPLIALSTLFMVSSPSHFCKVTQLSNYSFENQRELTSPMVLKSGIYIHDSCHMYDIDYDYLDKIGNISVYKKDLNISGDIPTKACDNGWVYDKTNYDATAVTDFDLVCDRDYFASMILSINGIGSLIGTPIFSMISDRIGRRKGFVIILSVTVFSTISPTILRDLNSFIIFRFILGLIMPSFYQIPYIILLEIVGPSARTTINAWACIVWVFGFAFLPIFAYLTRDWIFLHIVCSSTIIIIFIIWKFLPESPRWLLVHEKYNEAEKLVTEMSKINGRPKPDELLEKLKKVGKKLNEENSENDAKNALLQFMAKPGLRNKFIIVTLSWISCFVTYFGINLNLYNFHGNQFVNFFLLSIIELPSYLIAWYCMETRLGRRWSNSLFGVLCGIALCIPVLFPTTSTTVINTAALVGKFCGTVSFMVIYQQAAELYPTPLRSIGLGLGSMTSTLVNIGLPYLAYLGQYGVWIPLFAMGSLSIVISIIATFLPETLNENLPQTIEEGNLFGRDDKYFSWAKTKKEMNPKIDNEFEQIMQ